MINQLCLPHGLRKIHSKRTVRLGFQRYGRFEVAVAWGINGGWNEDLEYRVLAIFVTSDCKGKTPAPLKGGEKHSRSVCDKTACTLCGFTKCLSCATALFLFTNVMRFQCSTERPVQPEVTTVNHILSR